MNRMSLLLAAALVALGTLSVARAQDAATYPSKPIRIVIPFPPGGATDLITRKIGEKLTQKWGQPVVVENKPGANTIIGTEITAKAAPDGYTIGFITDSHSINPVFRKNLPYDSLNDFAPITTLVTVPMVLVTHPSVPVKTLQELVAHAKANPGKLAYGSLGFGGPHYLAMEWFKQVAGIDLLHIPYQGSAPALAANVGGQIQLMFVGASTGLQYGRDGRLNVIASSPASRLPASPNLPSIAESGYREFDFSTWYGLVAPARTPADIVARLNQEVVRALRAPDMQQRFAALGLIPLPTTPEEFAAKLRRDAEHYACMVKLTGARGE